MNQIRVLIVDDHALLREGIRSLLTQYPDIEVVGEASNGKEAINQVMKLAPDIVLMDIAMPGLGGLEATLELQKISPKAKIIVLTQYEDKAYIFRFLQAGAVGYVLKKSSGVELVSAIRAVYQGGSFLHPQVAKGVIEGYVEKRKEEVCEDPYESLSGREKQVLKLIAEGHTSKEIAQILGISVKTVMAHRSNIMDKLDLHSRTELIKFALRKGIITT
jgi:DNA-binding NarL/FixJ family response regulator